MKKLISTNGLSHEDWLKYRKQGIGGSDAGAICGLNPYVSPMSIFYEKTSSEVEDHDNESMRQGLDLEEYAVQRFMEGTAVCGIYSYGWCSSGAVDKSRGQADY